jgi:hypothetical protein
LEDGHPFILFFELNLFFVSASFNPTVVELLENEVPSSSELIFRVLSAKLEY